MINRSLLRRAALATGLSAALGLGATACSRDYTVAYLYATATTTGTSGLVDGYQIDYQSGALTQLANSPTPSGGRNPVTLVAAPSGKFIYVLNRDDSNVVEFAVGTDGKLYPQNTYNTIGSFPVAAAVDPTGNYLYVASTYQPGFTSAIPGPGNLTVFTVNADGTLANPVQVNVGNTPTGVSASQYNTGSTTNFIYVTNFDVNATSTSTVSAGLVGTVRGFSHDGTSATLNPIDTGRTPIQGSSNLVSLAGVSPSAIVEEQTARFVYVTDLLANQVIGYLVQSGGTLVPMTNGPFSTLGRPVGVTVDPRAKYLYVANFNDSRVSPYAIDTASGTPSGSQGSGTNSTGTNPTCVTVEPALGIYLYTSNNADQTITGLQLDPHNGSLKAIQNTPFPASSLPTCVVAVGNGSHATQVVDK